MENRTFDTWYRIFRYIEKSNFRHIEISNFRYIECRTLDISKYRSFDKIVSGAFFPRSVGILVEFLGGYWANIVGRNVLKSYRFDFVLSIWLFAYRFDFSFVKSRIEHDYCSVSSLSIVPNSERFVMCLTLRKFLCFVVEIFRFCFSFFVFCFVRARSDAREFRHDWVEREASCVIETSSSSSSSSSGGDGGSSNGRSWSSSSSSSSKRSCSSTSTKQ